MKLFIVAALIVLLSVASYDAKPTKPGKCLNPVNCFVDPCRVSKCDSHPGATCVSDYCGGCNAHWYLNGEKINNCAAAEAKRSIDIDDINCQTVYCFVDPCAFAKCNNHPEAVCHSNYCGGCNAWFYLGRERVHCD